LKLVTVAQMRELERAAVAAGSSEAQLMEEAGLAVAQEAWMLLGSPEGRRVVVLAGPGNNGGDGLVAARHLADWGSEVSVFLPAERADDPLLLEAAERGVVMRRSTESATAEEALASAELVIDALLGIGKARPVAPEDPMGLALQALSAARKGYSPPQLVALISLRGSTQTAGPSTPSRSPPTLRSRSASRRWECTRRPRAAALAASR
jgi:NAD(P)H-hydrate epimerase